MNQHTHQSLCRIAHKWLMRPASQKGPGCSTAIIETQNGVSGEVVDAVGFRKYGSHGSVLVEVKVSRSDFLADAKKPHRINPETGIGAYRYYLAPEGVISVNDLPPKWGLIEVNTRGQLKVIRGHVLCYWVNGHQTYLTEDNPSNWLFERNYDAELSLLSMVLSRVGDAQVFQDRLRESNNRQNRMANDNNQLRVENRNLKLQNFILMNKVDELQKVVI